MTAVVRSISSSGTVLLCVYLSVNSSQREPLYLTQTVQKFGCDRWLRSGREGERERERLRQ